MELVSVCIGEIHMYAEMPGMFWLVNWLNLAVKHSARAFGTDEGISHPMQWFGVVLPQDTCDA